MSRSQATHQKARRALAPHLCPCCFLPINCLLHPERGGGTRGCPDIQGHDVLSVWLEGHLPVKRSSPSTLPPGLSEPLIHAIRRGLDSKAPFMCLLALGVWQGDADNGLCFRKGGPLNPCTQRLNMGGSGPTPHTEQNTLMFSSGPCVQRSGEAGLWRFQTALSRQATERGDSSREGQDPCPWRSTK